MTPSQVRVWGRYSWNDRDLPEKLSTRRMTDFPHPEATPVIPDLVETGLVVLARNIDPGSVDPGDLPMLGGFTPADSFRAPFGSRMRFKDMVVELSPNRAQILAERPTAAQLTIQAKAAVELVEGFIGRKSVGGIGRNFSIRRRYPESSNPQANLRELIAQRALGVFDGDDAEVTLQIRSSHPLASYLVVSIEPSRRDDLDAVFFAFNFHRDLPKGLGADEMESELSISSELLAEVDRMAGEFIEVSK